jgi:hypothetical protein
MTAGVRRMCRAGGNGVLIAPGRRPRAGECGSAWAPVGSAGRQWLATEAVVM